MLCEIFSWVDISEMEHISLCVFSSIVDGGLVFKGKKSGFQKELRAMFVGFPFFFLLD